MATGDNSIVPLYEPGTRITAAVTAAVTGGKFVRPSGNFQSGPLLSTASDGGNIQVATCGAGLRALGVAGYDGATAGDKIPVICGHDIVVPMTAGAAITAGQEVESDANGNPIPLATGRPNGMAISGAANGATVYIRLF
jgi:hypothetical protein